MILGKRVMTQNGESPTKVDTGTASSSPSRIPGHFQFPNSVIQAHRHMVTRLMRDQSITGRVSMVSALRGEGVTFSSLAMASTLSNDFAQRVCYVDMNWWWPSLQMKNLTQYSAGLAGILKNEVSVDSALVRTDNGNFSLLPAGQFPPKQRPSMARSSALESALTELSDRFDTLILDIPAILATSDALALAAYGDACLMVIRQGVTNPGSVKQALDDIANLPIKGVVLNRFRTATPVWIRNLIPDV